MPEFAGKLASRTGTPRVGCCPCCPPLGVSEEVLRCCPACCPGNILARIRGQTILARLSRMAQAKSNYLRQIKDLRVSRQVRQARLSPGRKLFTPRGSGVRVP